MEERHAKLWFSNSMSDIEPTSTKHTDQRELAITLIAAVVMAVAFFSGYPSVSIAIICVTMLRRFRLRKEEFRAGLEGFTPSKRRWAVINEYGGFVLGVGFLIFMAIFGIVSLVRG